MMVGWGALLLGVNPSNQRSDPHHYWRQTMPGWSLAGHAKCPAPSSHGQPGRAQLQTRRGWCEILPAHEIRIFKDLPWSLRLTLGPTCPGEAVGGAVGSCF